MAALTVAILVSALIFVHELGHFLAAKLAGVEVQKFYLGFDIPISIGRMNFSGSILRIQWGETQYGIGWLPFGGYVKMLGQDDADPLAPTTSSPRDFRNRPAIWRMIIILGGVTMNAIFAFIFTAVAFLIGINFQVPELGAVLHGGVAYSSGLEAGDRVVSIAGSAPDDFQDVVLEIVTAAPGERIDVEIERNGQTHRLEILPVYDHGRGAAAIGIQGASTGEVVVESDGAAARGGMQDGDIIESWRPIGADPSTPMLPFDPDRNLALLAAIENHPHESITLAIKRGDTRLEVTPKISASAERWRLGISGINSGLDVENVRGWLDPLADPLKRRLIAGDRILMVGSTPVATAHAALEALAGGAEPIEVQVEPFWSRLTDAELALALSAFASVEGAPSSDRRAAYESALDGQAANPDALRLLAAFPHRPLSDFDLQAIKLVHDRARLKSPMGSDTVFMTAAAELAQARHGRLIQEEGGVAEVIEWDAAARACALETHAAGERTPVITSGGNSAAGEITGVLISQASPGSPAAKSGLPFPLVIDRASIADQAIEPLTFPEISEAIADADGPVILRIEYRPLLADGTFGPAAIAEITSAPLGALDLRFKNRTHRVTETGMGIITKGWDRTIRQFRSMFNQLRALVTSRVSAKNIGGPILIVEVSYTVGRDYGLGRLLYLIAFISINLAIINLFPIPPFDGGHGALIIYESITRKPASDRILIWFGRIGLLVFLVLIVLVFWNDIARIVTRHG